jgi:hypothetical protein
VAKQYYIIDPIGGSSYFSKVGEGAENFEV